MNHRHRNRCSSLLATSSTGLAVASICTMFGCGAKVATGDGAGGTGADPSSSAAGGNASGGSAGGGSVDLQCHPLPAEHGGFAPTFTQYSSVFGVHIFATEATPCVKIQHAAGVMAQYLDNDQDGTPDNDAVIDQMRSVNAALVMFASEQELESSDPESIFGLPYELQDLYGTETHPEGSGAQGFDATLEEVLHLITDKGYSRVYSLQLGTDQGSLLCEAMDIARGGQFLSVPSAYPESAWYHYDDVTCDYKCMATEYFYWALTSILGAQSYPGRPEAIANEWELYDEQLMQSTDVAMYSLMTDPRFALPTRLPDGNYAVGP